MANIVAQEGKYVVLIRQERNTAKTHRYEWSRYGSDEKAKEVAAKAVEGGLPVGTNNHHNTFDTDDRQDCIAATIAAYQELYRQLTEEQ